MNNIINVDNGQLYFNLSYPITSEFSPYLQAIEKILYNLDYSLFYREEEKQKKGRPFCIPPREMLMMFIYSYLNQCFSSRDIESLCKRDLVIIKMISGKKAPDHSTIDRFIRNNYKAIENIFQQSVLELDKLGELGKETLFQDGTKIESKAGKYTFVWKGALEKYFDKLVVNIYKTISPVLGEGITVTRDNALDLIECFEEVLQKQRIRFPSKTGRGIRNSKEQSLWVKAREYKAKTIEYIRQLKVFEGTNRKSFSKTDEAATFMRMKEDYMGNGQLKPGYNPQVLVDGSYIVGTIITSDRTDFHTMVPALEDLRRYIPWKYTNYCADSGYDCLENYRYLDEHNITSYIKTTYYEHNKKKKVKNDPSNKQNYIYDEETDTFTCMNGKKLYNTGITKKKYSQVQSVYQAKIGCKTCKSRNECMKSQVKYNSYKKFYIDLETEKYRRQTVENINTIKGVEIRVNRSVQAEGAFGLIKDGLGRRRFHYKGKDAETEWRLLCIAANVLRYSKKIERGEHGSPFWVSIGSKETA